MMSTAMCIYSSLKHKHGVAWTAICYPAAINSLDVSNSTSLSLILAYEKHFEEEGGCAVTWWFTTSAILHLLLYVTSDTIKQATWPGETVFSTRKTCLRRRKRSRLRQVLGWCTKAVFQFWSLLDCHKEIHVTLLPESCFPSALT